MRSSVMVVEDHIHLSTPELQLACPTPNCCRPRQIYEKGGWICVVEGQNSHSERRNSGMEEKR